ncbi:hypothetical protein G9464_09745 [Halostella sp. JP-L12]|uniref:DUF7501 family protein n=1 Tax=Halostella TaxID=1843185 RepID=UPI000EF8200C|nr:MULTISPECIES: hypothetical protein [Halostella]NHN47879.1 hypothetical protein [Halostella sp. JP-L12]
MPTDDTTERRVLLAAAENADASPDDLAASVDDADAETVRDVLDRREVGEEVEAVAETDWDDPDRCPFCGAALADGGAGFMDHVEGNDDCRQRFGEWRDAISGDVGGEWGG